jgi:chemotaxis family two-component system sensor kinase Cph1
MSISLMFENKLWGLISCHGTTAGRPSAPARQFCRLLGETASRHIEARMLKARIQSARSFVQVAGTPLDKTITGLDQVQSYLVGHVEDMLNLFESSFGILHIGNESKVLGETKDVTSSEVIALVNFLRSKNFDRIVSSHKAKEYSGGILNKVSGFLYTPLSLSEASGGTGDFVAFFRLEYIQVRND